MLSNAPHLFGGGGPNLYSNALKCTCYLVSAWRVPPRLLDWPESVINAANAPLGCVCLQGPVWYVLSNAPHLVGRGPNLFLVLANAPRLCVCLEGLNLFCAL